MKSVEGMTQTQADEMLVIMWIALSVFADQLWFSLVCGAFGGLAFARVISGRLAAGRAIPKAKEEASK